MEIWVAIAALILNLIGLVIGAVWVIGKINAQSAVLANSIDNLNTTLIELRKWVGQIDEKVDEQGRDIAVLKEKTK